MLPAADAWQHQLGHRHRGPPPPDGPWALERLMDQLDQIYPTGDA